MAIRLDRVSIAQAMGLAVNPPTKGAVNIIDVSGYSGLIDFPQLEPYVTGEKQPRIDGAIIRLVDGTLDDSRGFYNYEGFRSLGIPVGVYAAHYIRASATSNKRQGENFATAVKALGEKPLLGSYGDWEKNPDKIGISAARQAIWKYIITYEDIVGDLLKAYTNAWWDANVANSTNGATDIPKGRDGWFASWYGIRPYVPWDWRQRYGEDCWVLWQYENRFKFDGVPGSVDMSTFNGTMAQFYAYFNLPGTPPPEPPGEEEEMKYKVVKPVNKRKDHNVNSELLGQREVGEIVTPVATWGDVKYPGAYWVLGQDGAWSVVQYYNPTVIYMQAFV